MHLLELINLRFFHFLKREKKIGGWIFWMRDGGVEENIFFFFKQKECEWIFDFFSCAAHFGVSFLFFFANVQKVSISWRLVVKFLLGHCKFRTDLVRAQTFQKGWKYRKDKWKLSQLISVLLIYISLGNSAKKNKFLWNYLVGSSIGS